MRSALLTERDDPRKRRLRSVSVIIPAFNAERTLEACIESLRAQTLEIQEIIVVDDASTDATTWIAARHDVRVLRMVANGGPGLARNAGARVAGGDVLAFIDADCVAQPQWVEHMVSQLRSRGLDAATGGYGGPISGDFLPQLQDRVLKLRQGNLPERIASTISSNLVCTRAFFEVSGGFPLYFRRWGSPDAVWGNEDEELGFLASGGGNTIGWVAQSYVLHQYRTTLRGYLAQQRFYAERIVMSYAWRPAMATTRTNYSRGSGVRDLALTALAPVCLASAITATALAPDYVPHAWSVFTVSTIAFLALPLGTLAGLRSQGANGSFVLRSYPVLLAVKAAWLWGAIRGFVFSLGGFENGSTQRRLAPAAFGVETRPAGASDVLRDGTVQRRVQALLLLEQPQPRPKRTEP